MTYKTKSSRCNECRFDAIEKKLLKAILELITLNKELTTNLISINKKLMTKENKICKLEKELKELTMLNNREDDDDTYYTESTSDR